MADVGDGDEREDGDGDEHESESAGADGGPDVESLLEGVLDGDQRALARAITTIENRAPGYRDLVAALHRHAGGARVVGVTGSPGAGKSTLVDRLVTAYRERGHSVGVVAVDPASPFTGGSVLGDRIRMSAAGDDAVFVRSMSARGAAGGLAAATTDAVTALDAAGKDRVVVETVGAGQSEVEVVRAADTVAVLVPPESGDDVQMLKAGILEIGDVFVVNKADLDGADRTVADLREMLARREDEWEPPVVETVATEGTGVEAFLAALEEHHDHLLESGRRDDRLRSRYRGEIAALLREEGGALLLAEFERRGADALVDRVVERESDPYEVVDAVVEPLADCVAERRE